LLPRFGHCFKTEEQSDTYPYSFEIKWE
jgi:hypothetical protein